MLSLSEQVAEDALFVLQAHIRELAGPFAPNYSEMEFDTESVAALGVAGEELVLCAHVSRALLDREIPIDDGTVGLLKRCAEYWARAVEEDRGPDPDGQSDEERSLRAEDVAYDERQLVKVRVLQRLVFDERASVCDAVVGV